MLNRVKYLGLLIPMTLLGCVSPHYRDTMLPDGNTWDLGYGATGPFDGCHGYLDADEDCVAVVKPLLKARGEELCGQEPYRVFACKRRGSQNWVDCKVQCKEPGKGLDPVVGDGG